ncbi:uncharacterized protein [Spinacia oleracea]|uniref:Uncharacterized protein isoform X2 n=1 Tax=Spinacia oleracea TaxID=3562 RepID=A0A9R0JTN4_SPIOL|nr:uncharacterized protein LOC110786467 isoform X2 [Spinacia oleracea]
MESVMSWVVQHKLHTVGCLWLSGITGSIAYNWSRPQMKTRVTSKKATLIEYHNELREKLGPTSTISRENGEVLGDRYKLLPVDLRDIPRLNNVIGLANLDPRSYRTWQANNKGSRKSLRWKEIICSREPKMLECGYYVMKYMYQIVLLRLQSISNVEEIFSPNPYTQEEIDDVREKWSRYFISSCL